MQIFSMSLLSLKNILFSDEQSKDTTKKQVNKSSPKAIKFNRKSIWIQTERTFLIESTTETLGIIYCQKKKQEQNITKLWQWIFHIRDTKQRAWKWKKNPIYPKVIPITPPPHQVPAFCSSSFVHHVGWINIHWLDSSHSYIQSVPVAILKGYRVILVLPCHWRIKR